MAKKKTKTSFLNNNVSLQGWQLLIFIMAFAVLGTVLLLQSFAAPSKSGSTSGSTITYAMVTDQNGDGLPNWADTITFKVSTTATTQPHVRLTCTQNGAVVYSNETGYYPSYPWPWTQNMQLTSDMWKSGAADCKAELYYAAGRNKFPVLATLLFHVNA